MKQNDGNGTKRVGSAAAFSGGPSILITIPIKRYSKGQTTDLTDTIVTEMYVRIQVDNRETICLAALPEAIDVLAVGYLYTGGYINDISDIRSIESNLESGVVSIELSNSPKTDIYATTKTCALIEGEGIPPVQKQKNLEKIASDLNSSHRISSLLKAANQLSCTSTLFRATGGVHSSGLWMDDRFLWIYDDIGRHNSVDKVIGRALQSLWPIPESAALVSTGRISSEIVNKVVRAGIRVYVSRSAPMGLAVQIAQKHGLTLVGFARHDSCNIYTHFQRVDMR